MDKKRTIEYYRELQKLSMEDNCNKCIYYDKESKICLITYEDVVLSMGQLCKYYEEEYELY